MSSDRPIAYGVLVVYVLLVSTLLPSAAHGLMLMGAAILFGGTFLLAQVLRDRKTPSITILFASFIGAAVLAVPNFPAMGGVYPVAVPLGFLGSQVVALLWLVLRWSPAPHKGEKAPLRRCLGFGAFGAMGLSAIATVPVAIGLVADRAAITPLLWVYPAYFAGTAAAALVYWLLQGVAHRPVGRYLIGVLGGMCVYAAVAPVVSIADKEPIVLSDLLLVATIAGVLVGPPVAVGLMADDPTAVEAI